jgi:hypothetical protein
MHVYAYEIVKDLCLSNIIFITTFSYLKIVSVFLWKWSNFKHAMYTFNWDNLAVTRLQFNISFLGCKRSVLLFNAMQRVIYHNHLVLCLNCAARASTNESSENISSCFISRCISSSIDWLFDAHQFVYRTPNLARYGFFVNIQWQDY